MINGGPEPRIEGGGEDLAMVVGLELLIISLEPSLYEGAFSRVCSSSFLHAK